MKLRATFAGLTLGLAVACGSGSASDAGPDADVPADAEADVEPEGDGGDVEAETNPADEPLRPAQGTAGVDPLDCTGAYELPVELTGPDGLGHFGWTVDDLRFSVAWDVRVRFPTDWISRDDGGSSLRTHPWLVPEAGRCYQREMATATAGDNPLTAVLATMTAFGDPWTAYGEFARDTYTPPSYDLTGENVLVRALHGLLDLPNLMPEAPVAPAWDATLRDQLVSSTSAYPAEVQRALARLVLAVGEAYFQKRVALPPADLAVYQEMHHRFWYQNYARLNDTYVSPTGGTFEADALDYGEGVDLTAFYAAALAVTAAAEEALRVLSTAAPIDAPRLDLLTPHGRILIDLRDQDTEWTAEELADAVVVVDLGGNDIWHGRYAATHKFWMSAAVAIDVAGDDRYNPETADIEGSATTARQAFDVVNGFTQGCGLFGVGVLIDGGGRDDYRATEYAQGSGAFGVGVLYDVSGADSYRLGTAGQGSGYFGMGLHFDRAGDDRYGVYTVGQGVGRPKGHGLLLDGQGNDTYIGYYAGNDPEFPDPGYSNYFSLTPGTGYSAPDGTPHYMSVVQGVGWGFRHEWGTSGALWAGGFGALLDFGTGTDEHYADCMAMGQGFVYGFGLLYDGGGDDRYRTFWWGPGASAHMGVNLLLEEDGDDDVHVTALSGGYGFDCSVGWWIDGGGNDTYGGQFNYGRAYNYGLTFFIEGGGDDVYNADLAQASPAFGIVDTGFPNENLLGAFLDLGGGTDTYNTTTAGVGNDANWYLEPVGADVNPLYHKGIGIDR